MDAFIGEIRLFPYNFVPQDWAICDGSALNIQQNPALFSVIGGKFGQSGNVSFNLPNLNGRVAMGTGTGSGLTQRTLADKVGGDRVTLTALNIASHSHTVLAKDGTDASAVQDIPDTSSYLAQPRTLRLYSPQPSGNAYSMEATTVGKAGTPNAMSNATRSTLQPYLTLVYCICLSGEYPIRAS